MKTGKVFKLVGSFLVVLGTFPAYSFDFNPEITISGFGTAGVDMTNATDIDFFDPITKQKISTVPTIENISNKPNFTEITLAGLQFTAAINDELSMTTQFVSQGLSDYIVVTDWLYIDWRLNDNWDFKIGRIRMPLYMHSQYLKVGYAYPWTRPPLEVYNFTISNFNGLIIRNVNLLPHGWESDMTIGFGQASDTDTITETFFDATKGFVAEWIITNESVKLRAGFARGDLEAVFPAAISDVQLLLENPCAAFATELAPELITLLPGLVPGTCVISSIDSPFPLNPALSVVSPDGQTAKLLTVKNANTEFYSLGYEVTWGHLISIAEWVKIHNDDKFIPDSAAWYVLVGFNWDNLTPYLTYSTYRTLDNPGRVLVDSILETYVNPFSYFGPLPIPQPQTMQTSLNEFFALVNIRQSTIDAGIRYDIAPSTAVKFDYRYVIPQNTTRGFFDFPPGKRISWVTAAVNVIF